MARRAGAGRAPRALGRLQCTVNPPSLAFTAEPFLGVRYLKKATIGVVRAIVAGLMLLIGSALVTGVLDT